MPSVFQFFFFQKCKLHVIANSSSSTSCKYFLQKPNIYISSYPDVYLVLTFYVIFLIFIRRHDLRQNY